MADKGFSQKCGYLFGSPNHKDYSILGYIGVPCRETTTSFAENVFVVLVLK